MPNNPLATIQETEQKLEKQIQDTKQTAKDKVADFKQQQETKLDNIANDLKSEVTKINSEIKIAAEKKLAIMQKENQSILSSIDRIDDKLIQKLANTIKTKVIK